MREAVNARFLKIALDIMNDQQLKHMALDIEERMDYLKTLLIESEDKLSSAIREEYMALKEIRSLFVVDLNLIG